jgi:hypothetical protein
VVQLVGPGGLPITGLISSDFTLRGAFTPVDIQFASCGSCFQEVADGLYYMVVETINNFKGSPILSLLDNSLEAEDL